MPPTRHAFVYLASQSPRRRQLLEQIGVRFELLLPRADEDAEALEAERAGELPAAYVRARDARQAACGARRGSRPAACRRRPILCSDTTVALGRRILGKPADAADATRDAAPRCRAARTASSPPWPWRRARRDAASR